MDANRSRATPILVVLNPNSGIERKGASGRRVAELLRAVGMEPEIVLLREGLHVGKLVGDRVRNGDRVVAAAGGDGTISAVATALVGTDTALGVLPAGTLNHFARDLGIPLELDTAARWIAGGNPVCIDVGEVNGRVFLNNSSIGLYPTMVSERELLMRRGVPKRLAVILAAMTALWRFPNSTVRLTAGGTGAVVHTPLVFVGNNEYEFSGWKAGTRARLHGGVLQIATVAKPSRGALFRAILLAAFGKASADPDLHTVRAGSARIETFRRHVKVAVDGEVVRMRSPLEYSIRTAALKVIGAPKD